MKPNNVITLKIKREISDFPHYQEVIPLETFALIKSTSIPKIVRTMSKWERSTGTQQVHGSKSVVRLSLRSA